jgi:beta-galactosidase
VVSPDASQSVRAWVDGDRIRLLVAGFNTGGNDHFFDTHYAAERRPLKKGATISSSFKLVLRKGASS